MQSFKEPVQVFKFGGASVKDATAVKNVATIIRQFEQDSNLLIVISAMGKTTNALESVVNSYFDEENYTTAIQQVWDFHAQICEDLFDDTSAIFQDLREVVSEMELLLKTNADRDYNFVYDQIVSQGEIFSTKIVAAYLNSIGVNTIYKDARALLRTDNTYREGKLNWDITEYLIQENICPIFEKKSSKVVLTQGFIAKTAEGASVTLGREGSDYSAAIFAYALNAQRVVIWKDVPGVLNADPKFFSNTEIMERLSYKDAIELAYYGATVIHPKTIKPLQNKNIPLWVKSFVNPQDTGTEIRNEAADKIIPSFIFKVNQALISVAPKDFSFIVEENLSEIFHFLAKYRIKTNLMQHSALSFQICIDDDVRKTEPLLQNLKENFLVECVQHLELITIKDYNEATIERALNGKSSLVEQKNENTARFVVQS